MMYEGAAEESTGVFGVLLHIFLVSGEAKGGGGGLGWGGGKSGDTKSRTICTFGTVEKVRAMRRLRERPLLLMTHG